MTKNVQTLALASIKDLSLADLITPSDITGQLPASVFIDKKNINFSSELTLTQKASLNNVNINVEQSTLELVVFSNLTFALFEQLVQQCKLTLISLNAINQRNNKTSYRFTVTSTDLMQARQKLVQFNLDQHTESVLIQNAPKLSEPGVLLMDMDSTAIKIECIDELAKLAGVGEQVAQVTELAMQGKLDFTQSLHSRVATLADAPIDILEKVRKNLPLMEGLETLVSILKQYHWRVAVASGGFTYFADHLKDRLDLDSAKANKLEIVDDKLTGKVLGDVIDANAKAENLVELAQQYNIDSQQTVAMGDGANDLVMMNAAGLGVAYHAKQLVVDKADVGIHHQGLDCLLHWLA